MRERFHRPTRQRAFFRFSLRTRTGVEQCVLRGHEGDVLTAAFSHDSSRVATGGTDGTVRLWNAVSGKELLRIAARREAVRTLCFSPQDHILVSGGLDRSIRASDISTGKMLWEAECSHVWSAVFSPRGNSIAIGSCYTQPIVLDAASGRESVAIEGEKDMIILCDAEMPWAPAFTPDGQSVAGFDGVWDMRTGRRQLKVEDRDAEHPSQPEFYPTIIPSPTGRHVVDCRYRLWERTRPEGWWGLAWLPAFWSAVLFAGTLAVSIRADRRALYFTFLLMA